MENISLFNDSFNINKTSSYYITIQLTFSSYSYCIVDAIRKRYVAVKHTNFENELNDSTLIDKIKEILKTDAFLNKSYKGVDLIYISQKSTLIPNEYFDKSNLKNYFKFNQILHEYEELHYNKLRKTEANCVFAIPSAITTLLVNVFPEINFYHQCTPLVENMIIKNKNNNNQYHTVTVNFNKTHFDVAVAKAANLLLYNSFKYMNENDFVYYVSTIYQQLDLKKETTELILSGDVKENSNFHQLAKHYFTNAKLAKINTSYEYGFDTIQQHLFSQILDLNRCE